MRFGQRKDELLRVVVDIFDLVKLQRDETLVAANESFGFDGLGNWDVWDWGRLSLDVGIVVIAATSNGRSGDGVGSWTDASR